MRIRPLVVVALLAVPAGLTAQTRPPVTHVPPPPPPPNPHPSQPAPQPAAVSRELQYRRSRWSGEAYSLITNGGVPDASGGFTRYTSFGNGLRGDYRYTDHWSATIDMTASYLFSPAMTQTGEFGTRYAPLSLDREIRPFFDARLGFMHMYDTYLTGGLSPTFGGGFADNDYTYGARYTRGFGAALGAGVEFPLTESLQLTSEASAMRNRMTTYRISGTVGLPDDRNYWMTALRFSIGVKLNPVHVLHLDQNPMK
jgi:hypothetical protein